MSSYSNGSRFMLLALLILGCNTAWSTSSNVPSDFNRNTAGGENALFNTGIGTNNTGFGFRTLLANGAGASNTGIGANALLRNTVGDRNTAAGDASLGINTTGDWNTAIGYKSMGRNITGGGNTALGYNALLNNSSGNYNLALGFGAGNALTFGGNNIYLGNTGITAESSSIRIGNGTHARTYIGGIRGKKTGASNAVPVVIDSNGQLGTVNSSARFKKDIKDMSAASQNLMHLRPVTYRYLESDENGSNPLEYGLIAEEVAKIFPDLVAYGADGQIETVQYQKLTPMLLNELQRLNKQLEAEKQKNKALADEVARIKTQFQEVAELRNQVEQLQSQTKAIKALTVKLSRMEVQQTSGINNHAPTSAHNWKTY